MFKKLCVWVGVGAVFLLNLVQPALGEGADSPRQRLLADNGWKFHLGEIANAQAPGFDDDAWRTIQLPHDWSIEGSFDPKSPTGGAEGFLPEGIGWYRRSFAVPGAWRGRIVTVEFEGVYMNARFWLNGQELGTHPYGYTSFHFDLTSHLKIGEPNLLAVRVDNSGQPNSRWYSGSGIYRHVWVTVTDPVHVAPWGVFVSTKGVSSNQAQIAVQTEVKNEGGTDAPAEVETRMVGPDGQTIGSAETQNDLKKDQSLTIRQEISVADPPLWSPDNPQMCQARTRVSVNGKVVDQVDTPFGIRLLQWSAGRGMQINGETVKLCGGCIHQDNGCLGSAAFDRAEERRIEVLRKAGFNALRMSHNPPSPALLDACDRLGMLVMDEAFDCWDKGKNNFDYHLYFKDWWRRDIDSMVMRDRNHPSVVIWSIGNEIPNQYDENAADIAKPMVDRIHGLDPTRPVTQALNGRPKKPEKQAAFDRLRGVDDIGGYNYSLDTGRTVDHPRFPERALVSTEDLESDAFGLWIQTRQNSFVLGKFVWTAMDYLGENGIGRWTYKSDGMFLGRPELFPWHGAYCGLVDAIGTSKDSAHYHNILWDRGEKLYLTVQQPTPDGKPICVQTHWSVYPSLPDWNWPGYENKRMKVEVYSQFPSVRLYQDGRLLGEKPTTGKERFRATFDVTYTPGTLKAVAMRNGEKVLEQSISTAGAPAAIRLTPDRTTLHAGGQDLSFVQVEVVDRGGRLVPNADAEIQFEVAGAGTIAGVGSGDMTSRERYQGTQRKVFQGRALIVIRTTSQPGAIQLEAKAQGLASASVNLQADAARSQALLP